MTFKARLIAKRKSLNWNQNDLSKKTGLTPSTICMIESGDRTPGIKTFTKIADALDVSLDWLVGRPYKPRFEVFPKEADQALRKIEEAYTLLTNLKRRF